MATFRSRLPQKHDISLVLACCVFLVFSWSIFWFFHRMPGWLPFLPLWDIVSIFAYTQMYALLESLFVLLLLIILAIILPARFFRDSFVAQSSMLLFMTSFWIILFESIWFNVVEWATGKLFLWFTLSLLTILIAYILVRRSRRLERVLNALADRISVFLYLYVPLGTLGLVVVITRNVLTALDSGG